MNPTREQMVSWEADFQARRFELGLCSFEQARAQVEEVRAGYRPVTLVARPDLLRPLPPLRPERLLEQ